MKKSRKTQKHWDNPRTDALAQALFSLRDTSQIKAFLRDLLTEPEIIEFGHRLYAARMLSRGVHYNSIAEDTGLSSATIARVQKWLKKGMGGYRKAISRLPKSTRD